MNYRRGWAALGIEKWKSWSEMKLGHSYRLASGTWGKAKAGAQLQVNIWDMGQGQSWDTVTVSARLASETWSKAKAGAQYSFSQVSFWDMARAGQGTAQFQSNSSSYLRGPAANFVCLVIIKE